MELPGVPKPVAGKAVLLAAVVTESMLEATQAAAGESSSAV
jgi:hypothetical protein